MAEVREASADPYEVGTDEPNSYNAEAEFPLNVSSFSTARPWYHLNTETPSKQPQTQKGWKGAEREILGSKFRPLQQAP